MHGAVKSPSFARLAAEPRAGDTTLTLSQPVSGWAAGDRLILPDTRLILGDVSGGFVAQREELTLVGASGSTITLTAPLQHAHPGARNGNDLLEFLGHVGNLSRNVTIRSQNPSGTRGHVFLTYRGSFDIRYALFKDLGRTTTARLDNTTFDTNGTVQHLGTNQIGRYPFHMHHVMGPVSTPANGYQYTLIGNAVDGGTADHNRKWGITIHDSHYGLVSDNVVYNASGAGLMTESGTEWGILAPVKAGDSAQTGRADQFFTVENSYLRNYVNVSVWTPYATSGGGDRVPPTTTVLRNVKFDPINVSETHGPRQAIQTFHVLSGAPNLNWVQKNSILVYDYNQVLGDNLVNAVDLVLAQSLLTGVTTPH